MSKFGQYQLLERVAVGGMGEVYRARSLGEEGFEKPVAIKRILPAFASDVRFVEMLVTEARIHAPLSHRNIVQIHDLGISEDHEYFIVLEFVDGHDLGALLARLTERRLRGIGPSRVPDAVALYIAVELGEGLHFAHEARDERAEPLGLIHRDISPSNVLLSYAGEVKLSDFGLAKRRTDHSIVGSLKGQLAYMSPEQARRAPLDRRTDIFSLGAVLFEMLTGQSLRTIGDDISGWQQVASGAVPNARQFRPDLLPALDQLLTAALAPDPRDRFPDARAFVAEARGALDLLPRSRAGEAGELTALLRGLLPPGRPRPAKAQSKVIRLLSELAPPAPPAPAAAPPRKRESGLVLPAQASTPAPPRKRESGLHPRRADAPGGPALVLPAQAPAPAPVLAASSPPPAVREREESRPPPARAQNDAAAAQSDGQWPALLDLVAPPITSAPAHPEEPPSDPGLDDSPLPQPMLPPASRPVPPPATPSPPSFRTAPPPIPQAARPPPTPPPIPWPPPPIYSHPPPPEPEGLSSVEEIEELDRDPMASLVPMQPGRAQPMAMQGLPPELAPNLPMQNLPPMPMAEMQPMPPEMSDMAPMHDMVPTHDMAPMHDMGMQQLPPMVPMQQLPPEEEQEEEREQQEQEQQEQQEQEQEQEEDPDGPTAQWSGEPPPPGWTYADTRPEMAQPAPYPIESGYAVAPPYPPRPSRRPHVLGIAAAAAILAAAVTHYAVLPLEVLAVWRLPARLEVDSTPTGAEVYIDGRRLSARTPTFTEVRRDLDSHTVELRLEGFQPERQALRYSRTLKLAVSARLIPSGSADLDSSSAPPPPRTEFEAISPAIEPEPAEPAEPAAPAPAAPAAAAQVAPLPRTDSPEATPAAPAPRAQVERLRGPRPRAAVKRPPGPRAQMDRIRPITPRRAGRSVDPLHAPRNP